MTWRLFVSSTLQYCAMRRVELAGNGTEWSAGRRLRDLAYADDICLIYGDLQNLRRLTETRQVKLDSE